LQSFRKFCCGGWRDPQSTPEKIDFAACFQQVRDAHSLGQLPVRIICAGTGINSPFLPAHTRPSIQTAWNHLQSQFLRLSSDAQQTFAPNSGHFVQRDAPEVITETIRTLL
jgi:pimeloyl-ACP methyl ester carboxylesterase